MKAGIGSSKRRARKEELEKKNSKRKLEKKSSKREKTPSFSEGAWACLADKLILMDLASLLLIELEFSQVCLVIFFSN